MRARARLLAVVATIAAGALGIISSTQTWVVAVLPDGSQGELLVAGAAALPVLAPLSLAALALGLALSIVGRVLRYVFGALSLVMGGALALLTGQVAFAPSASHVSSTVTEATGITGADAVARLVSSLTATPWPAITLIGWIVLFAAGAFTIATAHTWRGAGRRYRTDAAPTAVPAASRPHDAVDDWDDLSRGADPTA